MPHKFVLPPATGVSEQDRRRWRAVTDLAKEVDRGQYELFVPAASLHLVSPATLSLHASLLTAATFPDAVSSSGYCTVRPEGLWLKGLVQLRLIHTSSVVSLGTFRVTANLTPITESTDIKSSGAASAEDIPGPTSTFLPVVSPVLATTEIDESAVALGVVITREGGAVSDTHASSLEGIGLVLNYVPYAV